MAVRAEKGVAVEELMPADGMIGWPLKRDFGTPYWQLSDDATPFPARGEAGSIVGAENRRRISLTLLQCGSLFMTPNQTFA
jgi:hypothetical protein